MAKKSDPKLSGNGKKALENYAKMALPNLKEVQIKEKAGEEFFKKLLEAVEKEDKKEKSEQQKQLANLVSVAGQTAARIAPKELAEGGV